MFVFISMYKTLRSATIIIIVITTIAIALSIAFSYFLGALPMSTHIPIVT